MKKKLLLGCLIPLIAVPLLLALIGLALPTSYEVERSVVIDAPPAEIHPRIEDLRRWSEWSVWHERDPEMTLRFSGPDRGVDSRMAWSSDTQGFGELTITASDPAKGVWFDLLLEGKHESKNAILYEETAAGTKVTWLDRGDVGSNPLYRWRALAMDPLLGPDFEANLANLEAIVEGR